MAEMPRVVAAMVTPFRENLSLDVPRAKELALRLLSEGNDGLVVTGTTGECPTLSCDEKVALWTAVVETVGGRAMVCAGAGTNSTQDSIHLAQRAAQAGVDMVMAVAPYYNRPSQEGMYQHFRAVAESVDLPVILYNVPTRTASNIEADTVARLACDVKNVVAVKEASANFSQITEIRRLTPADFTIYSGNDGDTLPMMALGAHGVISVTSHLVGRGIRSMIERFLAKDLAGALDEHLRMAPIVSACFIPGCPSPAPLKAALGMVGFPVGRPRLPLVEPNEAQKAVIRNALADYGLPV